MIEASREAVGKRFGSALMQRARERGRAVPGAIRARMQTGMGKLEGKAVATIVFREHRIERVRQPAIVRIGANVTKRYN